MRCPYRLVVRTLLFHGNNVGSNPTMDIKLKSFSLSSLDIKFFYFSIRKVTELVYSEDLLNLYTEMCTWVRIPPFLNIFNVFINNFSNNYWFLFSWIIWQTFRILRFRNYNNKLFIFFFFTFSFCFLRSCFSWLLYLYKTNYLD